MSQLYQLIHEGNRANRGHLLFDGTGWQSPFTEANLWDTGGYIIVQYGRDFLYASQSHTYDGSGMLLPAQFNA